MASFDRLAARVEARAGEIAERTRNAVEVAIAEFPDIMLHRQGDALVMSGRGLLRRWIGDVRLRFALRGPSTSSAGPPPRSGEHLG